MTKAQVIDKFGPPEVMQWREWPISDPGFGEVRLRHTVIGLILLTHTIEEVYLIHGQ